MANNNFNIQGLSKDKVLIARAKYGPNKLAYKKENEYLKAIKTFFGDPMILLLLVATCIYFFSEKTGDGIFLISAIVLLSGISFYQDSRSRKSLEQMKHFTQPKCKVIRDGTIEVISSEELVMGDSLLLEEGAAIAADGIIVHSNDFSVDESILTGESLTINKNKTEQENTIYHGTTVASGLAIATVTAIGNETILGKIGQSLASIKEEKTPLELQINNFVIKMAMVGAAVFAVVWGINYSNSQNLVDSLLKALTLAMSILPEEIPVALTTFMALGAWRIMKMGILVKQMKTVETLGSATVICIDKTGTITENKMSLAKIFVLTTNTLLSPEDVASAEEKETIAMAMWASEPSPFDPMEVALHKSYTKTILPDQRPLYHMVHEYPLSGQPPMMTHIFERENGEKIIATKGAPEAIIQVCQLTSKEEDYIATALHTLTLEGYRVLGIGQSNFKGDQYPDAQQSLPFTFLGIIAFYDPPKQNIEKVLQDFYNAGIAVKIITGDNPATTKAIAQQIGFKGYDKSITGDELMKLSEQELEQIVLETNVYTRMFPEAKLKIINALKAQNEIVAMTGDGVNDGPALKSAHIGIAMGVKGSEIAKEAASLILLEDDLSKMVDAVAMGRKIYANLKKAIQFVISIHIPIILLVFVPLALGWVYPNIFYPIHIIFFELIMGPTCSIIYENEPMEENAMQQPPRPFTVTFFNWKELSTSFLQGIIIGAGSLFIYQYSVFEGYTENLTRTMVFVTLIIANIFLTLVNRSFYYSILTTMKYPNNLVILIISTTIIITGLMLYIVPFTEFFALHRLSVFQLFLSLTVGFVSVIWYELVKWNKRMQA